MSRSEWRSSWRLQRWVGSWLLSLQLRRDAGFMAADAEASAKVDAGDLGPGVTVSELRARYKLDEGEVSS